MSEKTKAPTQKKLEDSRKKGQVAHSPVVVRFVASIGLLELILSTRHSWLPALEAIATRPFDALASGAALNADLVGMTVMPVLAVAALISVAAVGFAALLAVAANLVQVGFMVAPEALPKWEGFDPVANLTQMFSMERLQELLLNIAKVLGIGGCAAFAIYSSLDTVIHLGDHSLALAFDRLLDVAAYTERSAMAAIILLVVLDWVSKRMAFMKQMRMSVDDVKREHKDMDGDPHTKQHRKRLSREIMLGEAAANTRKADVVVTNPTHFAVALGFRANQVALPFVLARGSGEAALKMIEAARKEGIPRVRYVWLARTLYSVGREGRPIPRVTLLAVVAVYRSLIQLTEQGGTRDQTIELGTDPDDPAAYPAVTIAQE